jgi:hypothetical protein
MMNSLTLQIFTFLKNFTDYIFSRKFAHLEDAYYHMKSTLGIAFSTLFAGVSYKHFIQNLFTYIHHYLQKHGNLIKCSSVHF